jgi:DNA-binding NtrC family response regulator
MGVAKIGRREPMVTRRSSPGLENALASRNRRNVASSDRHPILVIDDDKASRDSLSFVFGDQYNVSTYGSAKEGVAAVHEDICAVILDVRMPEQDGFSACDEIRRTFPEMPIIFYSAYQSAKDPMEVINDHRPFAYVVKDGDLKRLIDLVGLAVQIQAIIVRNRKLIRTLQAAKDA